MTPKIFQHFFHGCPPMFTPYQFGSKRSSALSPKNVFPFHFCVSVIPALPLTSLITYAIICYNCNSVANVTARN